LAQSFRLIHADYRVRQYLTATLESIAKNSNCQQCRSNAAYQMAFCAGIGFGMRRDVDMSRIWLGICGKPSIHELIEATRADKGAYNNATLNEMAEEGFLSQLDLVGQYRQDGKEEEHLSHLRAEIGDLQSALGTHWAVSYLKNVLASWVRERGEYVEAERLCRERKDEVEQNPDSLESSLLIASVNLVSSLTDQAKFNEAEKILRPALERWEKIAEKEHPLTLSAKEWLARLLQSEAKYDEAETVHIEVKRIRSEVFGKTHPEVLISEGSLVGNLMQAGKWKEAGTLGADLWQRMKSMIQSDDDRYFNEERHFYQMSTILDSLRLLDNTLVASEECRRLAERCQSLFGTKAPVTMAMNSRLILLYLDRGFYHEALRIAQDTLSAAQEAFGSRHPMVSQQMASLGRVLIYVSRPAEAEILFRDAMDAYPLDSQPSISAMLKMQEGLAGALLHQGKLDEAETVSQVVMEQSLLRYGEKNPETIRAAEEHARVLFKKCKLDEAEALFRQINERRKIVLGEDHSHTLRGQRELAEVLLLQERLQLAEKLCQETIPKQAAIVGEKHPETLRTMLVLARVLSRSNLEAAEVLANSVLDVQNELLSEKDSATLMSLATVADIQSRLGRFSVAENAWRTSMEGYKKIFGAKHSLTATCTDGLACCISNQEPSRNEEAKVLFESALASYIQVLGDMHPDTLICKHNLACCLYKEKRFDHAKALNDCAYNGLSNTLGPSHSNTVYCQNLDAQIQKEIMTSQSGLTNYS
jgi:hypothetical protein